MRHACIGLLALCLMSCAALGSRTKVYDDSKIRNVKTVGLVTKRFDQPKNAFHKIIKQAFTKLLIERLEKENLFKIIVLDTMDNEKLDINSYKTDAPIDALLFAEWKLTNPNHMSTDAKVKLSLLENKSKQVLLISRHGTKFGNSYWTTPFLPSTLLDATEGAIKTMEKTLKNIR